MKCRQIDLNGHLIVSAHDRCGSIFLAENLARRRINVVGLPANRTVHAEPDNDVTVGDTRLRRNLAEGAVTLLSAKQNWVQTDIADPSVTALQQISCQIARALRVVRLDRWQVAAGIGGGN